MERQWFRRSLVIAGFIGASAVLLHADTWKTALPGTVNYVEGQASIDGHPLDVKQNGDTLVKANETLSTGNGKVEMLLSPGVFVRTGSNSEIRMVSTGLVDPTIEVEHGSAMVEVDQKLKDARVDVLEHGAIATILKNGLYRFDADQARAQVFDGKMSVTENGASKKFGKGKEVALNGEPLKPVSFDRKAEDDLYKWSSLRSSYLAQANAATAQYIYAGSGPFWGSGWYWNPGFASWSWLPGDGYFYSPFGYPFFSPGYVVYGYRGGFAGHGFASHGFAAHGFAAPRTGVLRQRAIGAGGFHGSAGFPGLHGGGTVGGGFHGGRR
jgi:hypothetical protein